MAKRRPTDKTQSQRSTSSKPTRQERRQAARSDVKAKQTVATASPLTAATSYLRQDALALVALSLLVVVSYLPAMLWGGFVWDDGIITKADPVRDVSGLWQIWFSPSAIGEEAHYWPLVYTTFWLEHKLWGFDPTGYHIVNVLLHLANTLLVWHLMRRLAVPGAWMVAAVFAVHPLHVESVAWVIERKDVLSGLFYLAAVLAYMRFVEQPSRGRYAGSLALYAAGMLSKSIVVTLPVALLLWHWWKQGRVTATDLLRLVPFFAVGLVITVGDLSFYQSMEPLSLGYSFTERTLIAARALWFYVGKLLWPTNLAVIYPLWDIRVADPLAWGYVIASGAVVATLWCLRHRLGRGPLAGALFFAVTLSPVLGFVDYGYMQFAFVADRFQYLAGIGVMAVGIGAAARLTDLWRPGALAVAAVAVVVLGTLTWRQASIYRDGETFHRHIIALNPLARNAHFNLGDVLYEQDRYAEALEVARVAVEQRPDFSGTHANLGAILNKLGRFEEAEKSLRRALELNPQAKNAHRVLGKVLYNQGRHDEALATIRIAVEQDPDFSEAHANLGAILNALGRFEEAEKSLRRALELNPQAKNAHRVLGKVLYNQGRYDEALATIRIAVEQDPDFSEAHANLGTILNALGRFEEAETHLRRALELNPQEVDLFRKLAEALMPQGRYDEAMDALAQSAGLDPASPAAAALHVGMGQIAEENGQLEAAAQYYMHTLNINPRHAEALYFLATLRFEQQRYDEMLQLLQRLIAFKPNDAEAHASIGVALYYLGRSDEALQRFDHALSLDPTLENARTNREAVLEAMAGNR